MEQANVAYQPQNVVEFADGTNVIPENQKEEDFLISVANNPTLNDFEKERVAQIGTLINPDLFDINFNVDKRARYPTDLDPQLRQLIREA